MKRKEMVGYMGDALAQFFPTMDMRKRNLIADVLLTEAEKYGVKPPMMLGYGSDDFIGKHGDLTEREAMKWEEE